MQCIVVPLDGSAASELALPMAIDLAQRSGAELHVVRVHVPQEHYSGIALLYEPLDEGARRDKIAYLESHQNSLSAGGSVSVKTALLSGNPAIAISEYVQRMAADLVVLTSHGRGGFSRFWLGSVADDLLRRMSVPTVLMRIRDGATTSSPPAPIQRILVPLDGSPLAEEVLGSAERLAQLYQAELVLLEVVAPIADQHAALDITSPVDLGPVSFEMDQVQQQLETQADSYLHTVAERVRGFGLKVTTELVIRGQTANAILESAQRLKADMIAMATSGRGGVARAFFGSVADKVIRGAVLPMLIQPVPRRN